MKARTFVLLATALSVGALQLPDTSGIDGQLTANLGVDHFFSLWLVFNNNADVQAAGQPFTIFAPKNTADTRDNNILLQQPEVVKKLLLDHVYLGSKLDLTNVTAEKSFKTLGGRTVTVRTSKEGQLLANDAVVINPNVDVPNGILVILDNYLFQDEQIYKKNITTDQKLDIGHLTVVTANEENKTTPKQSFIENVQQVLSFLKSGVRVFQHFLMRSNVSKLLENGQEYTVFVPTDHAFQRWHPIDWGFYPFSVPEFTENIIINHFVKGRLSQDNIQNEQQIKTIGGRDVTFRKTPNLTINGAAVVKGDTPVENGNIMFISEVLFVSEAVVAKLHQQHRDKETPPLLAFPWFGAQFLSHAFLALERDRRFSHITRFLNLADLAPHVSGTGYTFFVPVDTAFEELGLDKMPDNYLSAGDGLQLLLNHFVKGRLYNKDLADGTTLQTLGNKTIHIVHNKEHTNVNKATIIESEIFVYNLGTMYYIDKVLFADKDNLPIKKIAETPLTSTSHTLEKETEAETVPQEITEDSGLEPDILIDNATTTALDLSTTENVIQTTIE